MDVSSFHALYENTTSCSKLAKFTRLKKTQVAIIIKRLRQAAHAVAKSTVLNHWRKLSWYNCSKRKGMANCNASQYNKQWMLIYVSSVASPLDIVRTFSDSRSTLSEILLNDTRTSVFCCRVSIIIIGTFVSDVLTAVTRQQWTTKHHNVSSSKSLVGWKMNVIKIGYMGD